MTDALRDYKPKGSELFVTIKEGAPVKLRVLTTDPLVALDKYGNTKFAFVVWNHTEGKAQILNKGWSIAGELQKIHLDEDFGADIQKVDIKITATGQLKDTRYSVNPLPNAQALTESQLKEVTTIQLEKIITGGTRMSKVNEGADLKKPDLDMEDRGDDSGKDEVTLDDDVDDKPVDLSDIPF